VRLAGWMILVYVRREQVQKKRRNYKYASPPPEGSTLISVHIKVSACSYSGNGNGDERDVCAKHMSNGRDQHTSLHGTSLLLYQNEAPPIPKGR
jgi:hypothetical protein